MPIIWADISMRLPLHGKIPEPDIMVRQTIMCISFAERKTAGKLYNCANEFYAPAESPKASGGSDLSCQKNYRQYATVKDKQTRKNIIVLEARSDQRSLIIIEDRTL